RHPPPIHPEESRQRRDDGRDRRHWVQLRGDFEPRDSMRVLSDRSRVERGAAAFAEDETRICTDEKVARDDQADDEGEDAIDEADGLVGHARVNATRVTSARPGRATCAALGPL